MAEDFYDFLLTSHRFNLTEPKDYFINDTCYGDDLGKWLRGRLTTEGFETTEPVQEDWGWFMTVEYDDQNYVIAMNGNAAEIEGTDPNLGEWRISVQKLRSAKEKFFKKNKLTADDQLITMLSRIMSTEENMRITGVETSFNDE